MDLTLNQALTMFFLALTGGLFSLAAYLMKDLHGEFKVLKEDHQKTKDRVLVLETRTE